MSDEIKISKFNIFFILWLICSLFAWIVYSSLNGVFGFLAFSLISFVFILIWLVPYIGIVLGFIEFFNTFGANLYTIILNLVDLSSSWLTLTLFWIISSIGIFLNIIFSYVISNKLREIINQKQIMVKNYALINCNIIDGIKDSQVIRDGVILIQNKVDDTKEKGKIVGIGNRMNLKIPEDGSYEIIDLENQFVLPGLINAHCHLTSSGKPLNVMGLSTRDEFAKYVRFILKMKLIKFILLKIMYKNSLTSLKSGVTTLRSMGDPNFLDVKLREKIEKNKILGPRLIVSGPPVCTTGGHGAMMGHLADSVTEVRKAIRFNLRNQVDLIKIISTGGVMDSRVVGEAGRPQMTIEEIETACIEAHKGNIMVATHCESSEGIRDALLGGVDTIEHGALIKDELINLFKTNSKSLRGYTALTPTLSAPMGLSSLPIETTKISEIIKKNSQIIHTQMIHGLRVAYKNNIKIAVGTDASVPYSTHYEVWKELKYITHYVPEISNQEAIYLATQNNAEILGINSITGSLEIGKFADIQVVKQNPIKNIEALSNVSIVFIKGNIIKNPKVRKIKKIEQNPIKTIFEPSN